MKLDAAGKITLLATLSGKGLDQANDLAVDAVGNLYLAGVNRPVAFTLALFAKPGTGSLRRTMRLNREPVKTVEKSGICLEELLAGSG